MIGYKKMLDEDEIVLVHRVVKVEMDEPHAGRVKAHFFEDMKKHSEARSKPSYPFSLDPPGGRNWMI